MTSKQRNNCSNYLVHRTSPMSTGATKHTNYQLQSKLTWSNLFQTCCLQKKKSFKIGKTHKRVPHAKRYVCKRQSKQRNVIKALPEFSQDFICLTSGTQP